MIRLLVDSSADFSKDEIESKKLSLVPLQVNINGETHLDGVNLFRDEFYEMLVNSEEFPKTSQPSPQEFLEIFDQVKKDGDTLICILLSSALSGTYQSATLAKNIVDYDNIYLVDSLTATVGIRVLVDQANKMIDEGKDAKEIVEYLETMKSHIKILAAVDTLEYLCKGGRVSKAAATIGEMANIKPVITVSEEGKVDVIGKRLGTNKTISFLLKKLEEYQVDTNYPIYFLFTYGTDNLSKLEAKLENGGVSQTTRLQVGPTIGTHIGPEVFGICVVEKF